MRVCGKRFAVLDWTLRCDPENVTLRTWSVAFSFTSRAVYEALKASMPRATAIPVSARTGEIGPAAWYGRGVVTNLTARKGFYSAELAGVGALHVVGGMIPASSSPRLEPTGSGGADDRS